MSVLWSIAKDCFTSFAEIAYHCVPIGVQWAGVEPVRGQYNQTYLDIYRGMIQKLQENGIYILVDQHQDVWSAQTCGHGAPLYCREPD